MFVIKFGKAKSENSKFSLINHQPPISSTIQRWQGIRKYLDEFKFKQWNKHRLVGDAIQDHDLTIHTLPDEEEEKKLPEPNKMPQAKEFEHNVLNDLQTQNSSQKASIHDRTFEMSKEKILLSGENEKQQQLLHNQSDQVIETTQQKQDTESYDKFLSQVENYLEKYDENQKRLI